MNNLLCNDLKKKIISSHYFSSFGFGGTATAYSKIQHELIAIGHLSRVLLAILEPYRNRAIRHFDKSYKIYVSKRHRNQLRGLKEELHWVIDRGIAIVGYADGHAVFFAVAVRTPIHQDVMKKVIFKSKTSRQWDSITTWAGNLRNCRFLILLYFL